MIRNRRLFTLDPAPLTTRERSRVFIGARKMHLSHGLTLLRIAFLLGAMLYIAGCATVSAEKQIDQSIAHVEQATGVNPQWHAPWDDAPPVWDGQSILELEEAVALALRNNRELRADMEMIGQANADLVQAGLLQNPRFNFMAMFPDGGGRSMLRSSGFPLQALQDLWLRPARKEVAAAQLQQAVLRVADRAVETVAEVKRVYARIQFAQRAIELIRANMEIVEQTRRLVQTQQSAGKATLVEVSVPRIRYLRLQSELLTMDAEYRSQKRQLLMLMGFAKANDAWSVTPIHELDEEMPAPPEEETLLALAEESRLDLQAAKWTLGAAQHQVELMRREAWPEVMVGLSFERAPSAGSQGESVWGQAGNTLASAAQGAAPGPYVPYSANEREPTWMVGPMIDFELPIFDQNQAQIARAVHEYRQRYAEYDGQRQTIAAQVRETKVMYEQAYEQVLFFRDAILPEVERNLEVVRESYRAGREEVTIVLQVQEDLIMTRLAALGFVRDLLINHAELEREVGGRLEPDDTAARPEPRSAVEAPAHAPDESD